MIKDRLSSAVMESLLALTIFREEFSGFFVTMFATLGFVKVLHWLVQDRVDYVEVTPTISRLQHFRIVSFMVLLLVSPPPSLHTCLLFNTLAHGRLTSLLLPSPPHAPPRPPPPRQVIDSMFLQYTVHGTIQAGGQSVMLLFAFEYVIQASNILRYFSKYVLSMVDLCMEGRWENKGTYVFYLELVTDLLHLFVYCIFFFIVFTNYGLPLHLVGTAGAPLALNLCCPLTHHLAGKLTSMCVCVCWIQIRDLYSTFRNFRNRITDFLRFRQVTARLDRFPDASAEDLQRSDGVCIICRCVCA